MTEAYNPHQADTQTGPSQEALRIDEFLRTKLLPAIWGLKVGNDTTKRDQVYDALAEDYYSSTESEPNEGAHNPRAVARHMLLHMSYEELVALHDRIVGETTHASA